MYLKNRKIDLLVIGDIVVDAFIQLENASLHCKIKETECELCFPFGAKIPYQKLEILPASGNSANIATTTTKLGIETALLAYLGNDLNGLACLKVLKEKKVNTQYIVKEKNKKTNYNFILNYENDRTILTKHTEFNYQLPKLNSKIKYLYLTSLAENSLTYHDQILNFLEKNKNIKLIFQPGTFQIKLGAEKLKNIYQRTQIFFANVEEVQKITQTTDRNIFNLAQQIKNLGPELIIISDGLNGAYLYYQNELYHLPIYKKVKTIDKTGAGDAFTGAIIAGLIENLNPLEAFKWGPINAWSVIQKIGSQNGLLSKKEILKYLKEAPENYQLKKIN